MRILSLNAWAGRFYPELIDYLVAADADVLCLQEVLRSEDPATGWVLYEDGGIEHRQRGNLLVDLRRAFPDHDARFFPAMRGEMRVDGGPVRCEFGLATLTRRSLAVVAETVGFVHGAFSPDGWGEHPRSRNAHVVTLFDYASATATTVVNLHGLRDAAGKHDTPERERQAEALVRLIRHVWSPGERLVVCGDLNLLPNSSTFEMLGTLGLVDLVTTRGFTDTRTSHYRKPERYADYMLVTPEINVIDFDVAASPEVSDHRPLVLDFR